MDKKKKGFFRIKDQATAPSPNVVFVPMDRIYANPNQP